MVFYSLFFVLCFVNCQIYLSKLPNSFCISRNFFAFVIALRIFSLFLIIPASFINLFISFFGAKFQRSIEEILVSSCASSTILLGYMSAGVMRGLLIGGIVLGISLCFVSLPLHSTSVILAATFFSACIFSHKSSMKASLVVAGIAPAKLLSN